MLLSQCLQDFGLCQNEITAHQSIVQCLSKLPLATMQTTSFSSLAIHEQFAHIPSTLGKYHGPTSRSSSNNVHSPQSSSHFLHIKTCPKSNVTYLKHLCCCWLEEEQMPYHKLWSATKSRIIEQMWKCKKICKMKKPNKKCAMRF
jgi:hypothetical protein